MTTDDLKSLGLDLKYKDLKAYLGEGTVEVTRGNEMGHLHVSIRPLLNQVALNTFTSDKFIPLQGSHLCDYSPNTISDDCKNKSKAYGIVKVWESLKEEIKKDKASAQDWNNVGCAYIWWNENWTKAVEMFENALKKSNDSEIQRIIKENLNNAQSAASAPNPIHLQVPVRSFKPLKRVLDTLDPRNVIMEASIRNLLVHE